MPSIISVDYSTGSISPVPAPIAILLIIAFYVLISAGLLSIANKYWFSGGASATLITNLTKSLIWMVGIRFYPSLLSIFKYGSFSGVYNHAALKWFWKESSPVPYKTPAQITITFTFSFTKARTVSSIFLMYLYLLLGSRAR